MLIIIIARRFNMALKDLSTKFDFEKVEEGKYNKWLKEGYFKAGDISKTPYTIVIPPPNITGKLHMGHALDNTLQDIIIRRKRMQGYDALFLPGMDHASIATQTKVEEKLRAQGISRYDLGRDAFLKECWKWKEEHSDIIHGQWAIEGISVDYDRERFTLDEGLNHAVNEVFTQLYKEGLIYRGEKIINWDVQERTALSNIEVIYKDDKGAFYHILYPLADGSGSLEIATTRPETMFGDVALMVHPDDPRYQSYIGKTVKLPLTNREIPVIADSYVDREFGTGVVKVTPAHDPNDFEVGQRHHLEIINVMNEDGTMNANAGKYEGMDRFACRDAVEKDLKELGLLIKKQEIVHSVGHSERTGVQVEPRLSKQWFVAMRKLADKTLEIQKTEGKIHFVPARFEKTFTNWLTDIQDWCISRQLWWGHQIPAWYRGDEVYVGTEAPKGEGWKRDEDALDTWFSSGLWPFSTLGWPDDKDGDYKRYYPTDCMVTGYDIIFFWVARMAFLGEHFTGKRPFKDVLIHGLIRDELGRKVSKSLNNGVSLTDARATCGMDALRYFLATSSAPGMDFRYSNEKLGGAWNYINKIWNIARFIGIHFDEHNYHNESINKDLLRIEDKWILTKLNKIISTYDTKMEKYDFGGASKLLANFVWDDFASWYVEMTKVVFSEGSEEEQKNTCAVLCYVLTTVIKLLHPFMPFVTEEIWQSYQEGSICVAAWPTVNKEYSFRGVNKIESLFSVITAVRGIRHEKEVPNSKPITLEIQTKTKALAKFLNENTQYLKKFTNATEYKISLDEITTSGKAVKVLEDVTVAVPLADLVNFEEELKKLEARKEALLKEVERGEKMLNNPSFMAKAPKAKIDAETEKLKGYKAQLADVEKMIEEIK